MNIRLPQALDASIALIADGYQSLGMDWWAALETAQEAGRREVPDTASGKPAATEKTEEQKVAENNAVLASIMGGLGQSDFSGRRM